VLASSSEAFAALGEQCLPCHGAVVTAYRQTGMGRSIGDRPAPVSATFYHRLSNRYYSISSTSIRRHQLDAGGQVINTMQKPIAFAIGSGNHAITYVSRTSEGRLLELPVSWYAKIGGYAMSPGYDRSDSIFAVRFPHRACSAIPQVRNRRLSIAAVAMVRRRRTARAR
jgi:hypothetical protein